MHTNTDFLQPGSNYKLMDSSTCQIVQFLRPDERKKGNFLFKVTGPMLAGIKARAVDTIISLKKQQAELQILSTHDAESRHVFFKKPYVVIAKNNLTGFLPGGDTYPIPKGAVLDTGVELPNGQVYVRAMIVTDEFSYLRGQYMRVELKYLNDEAKPINVQHLIPA
jgi:hypothetical protein